MASSHITFWQIDGEKVKTVIDFVFLTSKITAMVTVARKLKDAYSQEEHLDKPRQHIKKQTHHFADKDLHSQTMFYRVIMYGCESQTIKKPEHQGIDALELWYLTRLLRVPWTTRRSNQLVLKEIYPEYSLEGLMLKLKLQYFGHLMQRANPL